MMDSRIPLFLDAARKMQAGDFHVQFPTDHGDALDQLAQALQDLSTSLEHRFDQLYAVSQVAERANAGLMLDEVCDQVYVSFKPLIPYNRIGLALLEDDGKVARARWARSDDPAVHLPVGYSSTMKGSSLATIIATGQPRIIDDLLAYLERKPQSDSTRRILADGMRSSLTCPLVAEGKPVGFLFFSSTTPRAYQDAHAAIFQAIASQLSMIVEKSRLYQELVQLDQFKSRMLGMAAHDLRNPLSLVLSSLELLELGTGGTLSAEGRALVGNAVRASQRMVTLLEDLLDVTAIDAGHLVLKIRQCDVVPWLVNIAQDQRLLASSKGMHIHTRLPGTPLLVHVDPERMEQVLVNLITNAIKFSPPGTDITVAAASVPAADGSPGVELALTDQGPGIPKAQQHKLFRAFVKTSNRPTGGESSTGLGLAIAKRIVQAHGGRITLDSTVDSTVGTGSTFRVWLPA